MVIIFGLLFLYGTSGQGQALFQWPDHPPDLSAYTEIEDCLGAIRWTELRIDDQRKRREDTIAVKFREIDNMYNPIVADIARTCGKSIVVDRLFSRDTLVLYEMVNAYQFLLYGGRTDAAYTFGLKWFESIPVEQKAERANAIWALAGAALSSKPARIDEALWYIGNLEVAEFWYLVVPLMNDVWKVSRNIRDSVRAEKAARWLVDVAEILPDSITQSMAWTDRRFGMGNLVVAANEYIYKSDLLDSLAVGTETYWRYRATLRKKAKMGTSDERRNAAPLEGDFWFPSKPTITPPTRGKISVVVASGDNECIRCLGEVAMVRRLNERFPEVEWTLLAYTKGFFGMVIEPPTPEQEARLIDSLYRRKHGLPATTVVQHTKFWRIYEPDRRRINEPPPLQAVYGGWGSSLTSQPMWMSVIDREGNIVTRMSWNPSNEELAAEIIDALTRQLDTR